MKSANKVDIYIMGKHYRVPEGLTLLAALEYVGYRLVRGWGCGSGFCGACATVYNLKNDPQLRFVLACQTTVAQGMCLVQIPFFPAAKAIYDLEEIEPTGKQILALYPDLASCSNCSACNQSCPQNLDVMGYISDALNGDIAAVAKKSFDCVMCGLCAVRCFQGLAPYNVALLCRRLYGRYLVPPAKHLEEQVAKIEAGAFDAELKRLKRMSEAELRRLYAEREIEPF